MEKSDNNQMKYVQEPIKNWFSTSILSQFVAKDKNGLNDNRNQRTNLNKLYVTNFDINAVSPNSWQRAAAWPQHRPVITRVLIDHQLYSYTQLFRNFIKFYQIINFIYFCSLGTNLIYFFIILNRLKITLLVVLISCFETSDANSHHLLLF